MASLDTVFEDSVFRDEAILPPNNSFMPQLPARLREARNLEREDFWESRQSVFLKQGHLLADYEDDFEYCGDPVRYYPTYQSLNDRELRGYFAWRTKIRRGAFAPAPLTFIFLHIYELINLIGVKNAEDAYERLLLVSQKYGSLAFNLQAYLRTWLTDFVVYYNLPQELLEDSVQVSQDQCIGVIERIEQESQPNVIDAVRKLAPKWLARSRFYAENFEDMNKVVYETLRGMARHYAKGCKRTLAEQLFGLRGSRHLHIFSQAVFCDPLRRRQYEYAVDSQCVYKCEDGIWSVSRRAASPYSSRKLEKLLKTIDQVMREEYAFGYAIKAEIATRWITKLIRETAREALAQKSLAEQNRLVIDFSRLDKIRADAASTTARLDIDEENASASLCEEKNEVCEAPVSLAEPPQTDGLDEIESRLLRCLLAQEDLGWVRAEGHLLSVLVDGINEKLYDRFGDAVLAEDGLPVPDYIEELKELIQQ